MATLVLLVASELRSIKYAIIARKEIHLGIFGKRERVITSPASSSNLVHRGQHELCLCIFYDKDENSGLETPTTAIENCMEQIFAAVFGVYKLVHWSVAISKVCVCVCLLLPSYIKLIHQTMSIQGLLFHLFCLSSILCFLGVKRKTVPDEKKQCLFVRCWINGWIE